MKFWQLSSIMREQHDVVRSAALSQPEWHYVATWLEDLDNIVASRDRSKLDKALPAELVRMALSKSRIKFYLSQEYMLLSRRYSLRDVELSALQAFDSFGGHIMEEALERGGVSIADL